MGETPQDIDPDTVEDKLAEAELDGVLRLLGSHEVPFSARSNLVWHKTSTLPEHPNGMRFVLQLKDGSVIDVTQKEFYLALLFFRNIGRPLSRAYIHESVWVRETAVPSRTMDTHVSRVRNKLALRPENGFRLVPVYSYGYRLEKLGA